jgi:hypothetical protein
MFYGTVHIDDKDCVFSGKRIDRGNWCCQHRKKLKRGTEVFVENLPQRRVVHIKSHMT